MVTLSSKRNSKDLHNGNIGSQWLEIRRYLPFTSKGASSGDHRAVREGQTAQATPRRRAMLRVDTAGDDGRDMKAAAHTAADPHRFAGFDEQWFWEDDFHIPRRKSWAEEHAAEVAERRTAGLTMEKLAAHFGKTRPIIREAMKHAASADESVGQLPGKMPRRRWAEDHAAEVAKLKAQGLGTMEIAKRFGKSDTTIRTALKHARQTSDRRAATEEDGIASAA